jgi:hypothetical protein
MDVQTLGIVAVIVAAVIVILYVWDRRTKQQPVDMGDAVKLALGAGTVAGGVAMAVTGDISPEVLQTATEVTQEMFVGKPEF